MDDLERIIDKLEHRVRDDYDRVFQKHVLDSEQRVIINDAVRMLRSLEADNQRLKDENIMLLREVDKWAREAASDVKNE